MRPRRRRVVVTPSRVVVVVARIGACFRRIVRVEVLVVGIGIVDAFWFSFDVPFPAMKYPPPFENCTIIGAFASLAASKHALITGDMVQFTAGIAYPFSRA